MRSGTRARVGRRGRARGVAAAGAALAALGARIVPAGAALGAALLVPAAAGAQQREPTPRDTAQARDTVVYELPEIEVAVSIAPTAAPAPGSGLPAQVSVFTREEIEAWEPLTLAHALATRAGVSFYDDLGSPFKVNLSTRGFNVGPVVGLPPGVSVFLDGVRQNEPDAAQVNFDLLPLEHVERIELLHGTGSLLGSNSLGGAINLVTRRGGPEPEFELEASGGSFGTWALEGSASGTWRGWDAYLAGGYESSDGWREATGARARNAFLNLGRRRGRTAVRIQAFGAASRAETAGSLPESLFEVAPRRNFTVGDFEDLDLVQASLSGAAPVGPGRGSATLYLRRHTAERFNVNQPPDPDVRGFSRNRTLGANLDWRFATRALGGALALRLGLDGARHGVHIRIFEEEPGTGGRTLTTDVESPSWDLAGYAIADLVLGRVSLSGGFRYDEIRVPFRPRVIGGTPAADADTTHAFRRWSPRAGVSLQAGPTTWVYASLGQSFRAPVILELACADPEAACPLPFALGEDPPLDPVVATTAELGARRRWGDAALHVALYRTDVHDDIGFIASEEALFEGYFANIGDTRREGLELGVDWPLPGGHRVYANYAYTRATYRTRAEFFAIRCDEEFADSPYGGPGRCPNEVEPGDRIPLVPDHQVRAGAHLRLPRGFAAGADLRYTGEQWLRGDEANATRPLDGYATVDARLEWSADRWGVSAIVTNLFDGRDAVFGTFNENRETGELERFLTPLQARAVKVILRRGF